MCLARVRGVPLAGEALGSPMRSHDECQRILASALWFLLFGRTWPVRPRMPLRRQVGRVIKLKHKKHNSKCASYFDDDSSRTQWSMSLVDSDLNLVELVYQHTGLKVGVASTNSLDPVKPLVAFIASLKCWSGRD